MTQSNRCVQNESNSAENKHKAPLFYRLIHNEWVETVKNLTGAEIKVLYYLRSLDPFGDRHLEYSITEMAKELNISKGAASKAVKKLDQIGLIDAQIMKVKIKITTDQYKDTEFPIGNNVSYSEPRFPIGNHNFVEETEVSYRKPQFPIRNKWQPESLPAKDSGSPKTIKTYLDFKDSLSEEERESFLNFGKKKASQLPKPPELTFKWIEANFEELAEDWNKSRGKTPSTRKWNDDCRTEQWLAELEELENPLAFFAPGDKLDKEKQAFSRWAEESKLVSWRQ